MQVEPKIFKVCEACVRLMWNGKKEHASFPSVLRTWNRYCPEHQDSAERLKDMNRVLRERAIPVDWFDVWDEDGERVCRACGAKLLTKKGKQHQALRWCQDKKEDHVHAKLAEQTFKVFATARDDYIFGLAHSQFDAIKEKFKAEIDIGTIKPYIVAGSTPVWNYEFSWSIVIMCEGCGKLATINTAGIYNSFIEPAQVHHKKPVHTINANEAMKDEKLVDLVFDHGNFIALCLTCHGKAHRNAPDPRLTQEARPRFKTIDSYFKKP